MRFLGSRDSWNGSPRRRDTKPAMASHSRGHAHGCAHDGRELISGEAAQYRDHTVVATHWVKPQGPRNKPDAGDGNPTAANVADDHAAARDTIQLAQEYHPLVAPKVVQQLRAEHDVERAVGNGQTERIPAHYRERVVTCREGQRLAGIEPDRAGRHAASHSLGAHAGGDVSKASSYVEESE
jgi:hypothetical protein